MTEEKAKKLIERLRPLQERGEKFPCPRCGLNRMNSDSAVRNALSRYADVYICTTCGMDEAVLDLLGEKFPLNKWSLAASFDNGGEDDAE